MRNLGMEEPRETEPAIKEFAKEIAPYYLTNEIDDKYPSPLNGLTAFEQLIYLHLGDYLYEYPLDALKSMVIIETYEEKMDGKFVKFPIDESDIRDRLKDPESSARPCLEIISKAFFLGNITDDVINPVSQKTQLQQILCFYFRKLDISEREWQAIRKVIKSNLIALEGGADLTEGVDIFSFPAE